MNSVSPDTVLFSIGKTTAKEIRMKCDNKIIISDFPAKDKLAEIAIGFFISKK